MGKRTGRPRGRPVGAKNTHTRERELKIEEASRAIMAAIPDAFAGDAHALLIAVYKDTSIPLPVRIDAAKAAIGFEKPKLNSTKHSGDADNPVHTSTRIEQYIVDPQHESNQSSRPKEARSTH